MNVKSSLYIKLKFLICCRVTLAYQVLRALLDYVDWMARQVWQGREVKQVSQDPLDHQETGFVESLHIQRQMYTKNNICLELLSLHKEIG